MSKHSHSIPSLLPVVLRESTKTEGGVVAILSEGKYKGCPVFLPNDGVGAEVGLFEIGYVVEADLDMKEPRGAGKAFGFGRLIGDKSFGYDAHKARVQAEKALHDLLQAHAAARAMSPGAEPRHQGKPPRQEVHRPQHGGKKGQMSFPFLKEGKFSTEDFATALLPNEESEENLMRFVSQLADAPSKSPKGVTLGSFIPLQGGMNGLFMAGPADLILSATKFIIDNDARTWRVLEAYPSKDSKGWGVVMTSLSEKEWKFDPVGYLNRVGATSTTAEVADAVQPAQPAPAAEAVQDEESELTLEEAEIQAMEYLRGLESKGEDEKVLNLASELACLGASQNEKAKSFVMSLSPTEKEGLTRAIGKFLNPSAGSTPEPEVISTPELAPEPEVISTPEPEVISTPELAPEPEVISTPEPPATAVLEGLSPEQKRALLAALQVEMAPPATEDLKSLEAAMKMGK